MKKHKDTVVAVDVLADAAAKAGLSASALHGVRTWLAGQMVANQYARLSEGGHAKGQVPLRQVFVDLPVEGDHEECFLAQFMKVAPLGLGKWTPSHAVTLGRRVLADDVLADGDDCAATVDPMRAVLLVGGPGQGKSTLGQLACQLHRAALLLPVAEQLPVTQQELLSSFKPSPEGNNLPLPASPALPLQVMLPDLAAWLSQPENAPAAQSSASPEVGGAIRILHFLAGSRSARAAGLTPEQLFGLACHLPCLLVLDGFDEVGAGQDRQRLVDAIRQLLDALRTVDAQVQVLATTRPQGYADEMDKIGVPLGKTTLIPLSVPKALTYAAKLVAIQFPDPDQKDIAFARLREAARDPSTQRLLRTPLQVTILTALLEQVGRVPKERWKLFAKYYDYTFNREVARGSYASSLLREHRVHIEQIHMRVALLLQVNAEQDGGKERISRERLNLVIETVLAEEEIAPEERADLVRDLSVAAEQRLVFLVEPEPGQFGFEIRSLQEFWAAWALSSGRDAEVEARLQQIANAPMFRNVLLFLESKFFGETSHLRDFFIEQVCAGLDDIEQDPVAGTLQAGAMLALEALEEGSALGQPKRARALMERACGLLDLPPDDVHLRLLSIVNVDTESVIQTAISVRLVEEQVNSCAWVCLAMACNLRLGWARRLADKQWPNLQNFGKISGNCIKQKITLDSWWIDKIVQAPDSVLPMDFWNLKCSEALACDNWVVWFCGAYQTLRGRNPTNDGIYMLTKAKFSFEIPDPKFYGDIPERWLVFLQVIEFNVTPSAQSLASVLLSIADAGERGEALSFPNFMWLWPLRASNYFFGSNFSAERIFAEKLQTGTATDIAEWRAAEQRKTKANSRLDSLRVVLSDAPWNEQSLKFGIPFFLQDWSSVAASVSASEGIEILDEMATILKNTSSAGVCEILVLIYCSIFSRPVEGGSKFSVDLPEILSYYPDAVDLLIPKPACLPEPTWLGLLNSAPAIVGLHRYPDREIALEIMKKAPQNSQLLSFSLSWLAKYRDFGGNNDTVASQLGSAMNQHDSLDGIAELILQTWFGVLPPEKDCSLPEFILKMSDKDFENGNNRFHLDVFLLALGENSLPQQRRIALLLKTYSLLRDEHVRASKAIVRQLRANLQDNKSKLENPAIWQRLALPAPQPVVNTQHTNDADLLEKSIAIQSLELKDIRGFIELKLELTLPPSGQGQWAVFLGQNGVGKTTLLRSLALALRNVDDRPIWPQSVYSGWPRTIDNNGTLAKKAWIRTALADGSQHQTTISSNGATKFEQTPSHHRPSECLLFAYGCRRGSATGGPKREFTFGKENGPEIATLFEEFAGMVHAESWLKELKSDNPDLLQTVLDAIKTFLDVETVELSGDTLHIAERGKAKLMLEQLSDGYLTSAGWFIDLLARWIHYAEREGKTVQPGFMAKMRGLVLIDEIDMHLHPRWQIEIIGRTRTLMPQMSFIVTTHNPLTLVGAKAEEIWILENDAGKISAKRGVEAPMLLTGGQIYTRYFGIRDIYPNGLGNDMQRYHFLSRFALRNDEEDAELEQLRQRLDAAGILPEWGIVPRTDISAAKPKAKPAPVRRKAGGEA